MLWWPLPCQPGQRYPLSPTLPLQVTLQSRAQRSGISWERWELLMLEKEAGMPEVLYIARHIVTVLARLYSLQSCTWWKPESPV